jgi:wyosine [tRNA(Phe)-imidazoG37] synthetase (radical SAM superfamily)
MAEEKKYLYGPVPSRRLGLSLGVDIVPFKICTLDCIYCQVGKTSEKTIERKDYFDVEAVLAELRAKLVEGLEADFITLSGSGEPTLNTGLGQLIEGIKRISNIPVAVLTNGTLLTDKSVRAECAKADVVVPSLDAGDEQTFCKVNRPHKDISIENLIAGLCTFRDEFAGQMWLEVFLVDGLNTDAEQIGKIRDAIELIRPDKVQLNTAVRPTAEPGVKRLDARKLQAIAEQLGEKCEVVADFSLQRCTGHIEGEDVLGTHFARGRKMGTLLSMLKRRPGSLSDICSALGIGRSEASKYLSYFQQQGVIDSEEKDGIVFFKAI